MGADGGVGVTDCPRGAIAAGGQVCARCTCECALVRVCLGRAPRGRLRRPGDSPLEMGLALGPPREVESGPAPQPCPSGQAWATAGPEAFAVEEGPPLLRRGALAPRRASTWILI